MKLVEMSNTNSCIYNDFDCFLNANFLLRFFMHVLIDKISQSIYNLKIKYTFSLD